MTVVAARKYKDKIVIGADTQMTWGQATDQSGKLHRVSADWVIGGAGCAYENQLMRIFAKSHRPKSSIEDDVLAFFVEFHKWAREQQNDFKPDNWFLFAFEGALISITHTLAITYHEYWAVGSGWEYARTALHLGHDVRSAIKVACELTIYCGEPIDLIEVAYNRSGRKTKSTNAKG